MERPRAQAISKARIEESCRNVMLNNNIGPTIENSVVVPEKSVTGDGRSNEKKADRP